MTETCFELYRGYPEDAGDTLENMIEKEQLCLVVPDANGAYCLSPGMYSCHIFGEGIYDTLKVFCVREAREGVSLEKEFGQLALPVKRQKEGYDGYQPTIVPMGAPEFFKRTQKDEMLCIWPDEVMDQYVDLEMPGSHQCMNQKEMEQILESLNEQCDELHLFSLGKTEHYKFDVPIVILTKRKLCKEDSWEVVLDFLREDEKVNILYQAQIHGNEVAAGEGALQVLRWFAEKDDAKKLLERINLIVVPRVNPEAAYLHRRMAYNNVDLNRDHMACKAWETRIIHQVFYRLMPEVVLDGHEFTFYVADSDEKGGFVKKGSEVMSSPGTSLNVNQDVRNAGFLICGRVFEDMKEAGWKINHFGTSENPAFGRVFYGLHQSLSFLIETRGIGGGRFGYEKRVRAQRDIILSYIRQIAAQSMYIKQIVTLARRTSACQENVVLRHETSGKIHTPYCGIEEQYYLDGTLRCKENDYLQLNDVADCIRSKVKSYIIPGEVEHVQEIIENASLLGAKVEKLEPEKRIMAKQYAYKGQRPQGQHEKDIEAYRLEAKEHTLRQGGYLFTCDDYRSLILMLLMEPDGSDSVKSKGSLFQQGLLSYDEETGLFPLYCVE